MPRNNEGEGGEGEIYIKMPNAGNGGMERTIHMTENITVNGSAGLMVHKPMKPGGNAAAGHSVNVETVLTHTHTRTEINHKQKFKKPKPGNATSTVTAGEA